MSKSSKIIQLFSEAKQRRDRGPMALALLAVALVVGSAAFLSYTLYARANAVQDAGPGTDTMIEELKADNARLEAEVLGLKNDLAGIKAARLAAESLEVEGVNMRLIDGELRVSGKVRNTGRQAVGDIELTLYCLDEAGAPVCEVVHEAFSHDGKPLKRGQQRAFAMRTLAPEGAKDVAIIVTGVGRAE